MIRAYASADEAAVVSVWLAAGRAEYSYLPDFMALTEARATEVFREVIAANCALWVDCEADQVRGYLALKGDYVDRLYVHPAHQGLGIGTALLNHAKSLCPQGLSLHTHQKNTRARRFYEDQGLVAVKFGVSPAPELEPDVEYRWRPAS